MESMRVAVVHNRYQQTGGEDVVFETECALLERSGIHVVRYEVDNATIRSGRSLGLAVQTVWNQSVFRTLSVLFERERVSVVHVHNTLPLISPAVYAAARRAGAAVVQTLHNYRLLCPAATLYRNGAPCELCVGRSVAWPGVVHACYRNERYATATVATMLTVHRAIGTYRNNVDRYIALTHFAKQKFVEGGLPEPLITVKPNSVTPRPIQGPTASGPVLFVGRLSQEKGVHVLLRAWREHPSLPMLRIVGDGPLRSEVDVHAERDAAVRAIGFVPPTDMAAEYAAASMLVFPSTWYECFGLTIVEAMAAGLPVVASRLGSAAEIVRDGETGLLFTPGDAADLARTVQWLHERPAVAQAMGVAARETYERTYTPERNLTALLAIYDEARTVASAAMRRR